MKDDEQARGGGGFLRGMAMTIGVLIMTGSGLCSAGMLVNSFAEMFEDQSSSMLDFGTVLGAVGVYGGVPFVIGWAIWRASRRP
jgi:hypothetical protein